MPLKDVKKTLEYRTAHQADPPKPFWPREPEFWIELAMWAVFSLVLIWLVLRYGFGMF